MSTNSSSANEASLHAVDYWQVLRNRYGIILLTFLLVFLTAAVITQVMPKKFASTAVVQVNPPNQGFGSQLGILETRQFFATQFEVIVTAQNLKAVASNLDLESSWGVDEDTIIAMLKGMIETTQRTGTDLIEITVKHTESEVAQEIAAEVANSYKSSRNKEESDRAEKQLDALNSEIEAQKDKVDDKKKFLNTVVRLTGRPYFGEDSISSPQAQETRKAQLADQNAFELKKSRDQYGIYIERLETLGDEQLLRYAAELPLDNNAVRGLNTEFQAARRELESLRVSGLGEKHPTLQSNKERLEGLESDLSSAIEGLRLNLETTYELLNEQLLGMENLSGEQDAELLEIATELQQYRDATREYESALSLLQDLKLKHSTERVSLRSPKEPITIREEPKKGKNPVSPNVTLNLVLGAIIGLIFGIAIAFFLEYADTSVKSLEDVERFLKVPVLAVIPKDVGVLHKQSGMSPDVWWSW